jgi:hypothetical protein
LQGIRNALGMREDLTQVLPDQLLKS